jgi:hypothetical protein
MAGDDQVHVVTVQLPGGGLGRIQYIGDVPPRIVLVPTVTQADPFAAMERMSAMMQQQEALMLRQMQELTAGPGGSPFVSTTAGSGVCMRSVRITYNGGDAAPEVVSSASGDCGPARGGQPGIEVNTPTPTGRPVPNTIEVKAPGQTPDPTRQLAWNR